MAGYDTGPGPPRQPALGGFFTRAAESLARRTFAERERWVLWLPVALGAGIVVYFELSAEPALWTGPTLALVFAALSWRHRARLAVLVPLMGLAAGSVGFAAAQLHTRLADAPRIAERIGPVGLSGRIVEIRHRPAGVRLVLDRLAIGRLDPADTPHRIRLVVRTEHKVLRPGQHVVTRAVLLPVPPPVRPGAHDFQRDAYFARIGATGFAVDRVDPYAAPDAGGRIATALVAIRSDVTLRIVKAVPGDAGAVAAALLTGKRDHIAPETMEAIRVSGLAHLLAISGLHIGMVAGFLFFAVRFGLALSPALALRHPIKKWAAFAALAGAFAYLLLTGATVPTQRAFVMLSIVLLGVLVDRVGLSMRLVAWAAALLMLLAPASVLSASFQMSFAAVVALIAAYELWSGWRARRRAEGKRGNAAVRAVAGIAVTSAVAGAATAPFVIFHFNRIAAYGLAANLAAVPVMTFWIMPMGLIALLAMPLGLEAAPLAAMGWGIELMLEIAHGVAGWQGAASFWPSPAPWGLALVALGGLWLCLWRTRWRVAGLPIILFGLASAWLGAPPDILVSHDGRLAAVRTPDGRLALSTDRAARFAGQNWTRREGQAETVEWVALDGRGPAPVRCDAAGCLYRTGKYLVAFPRTRMALREDCARADIVIVDFAVTQGCARPRRIVDAASLMRGGSHALWLGRSGIVVLTDRDARGDRPWVVRPPGRAIRLPKRRWSGRRWQTRLSPR